MSSMGYIRGWSDAEDLNEGNPTRFAHCVGADMRECVWMRRWVGMSLRRLDGGVVSLVSKVGVLWPQSDAFNYGATHRT